MPFLEVKNSVHDQPCIQITNPTKNERDIIKKCVCCQLMNTEEYNLSRKAGAFLQCDCEDYVLIEFWTPNFQHFVNFLNRKLIEEGCVYDY